MNRELEKLLKEKWFLVAADLIAVFAILIAMPDKRDGLDTFLVMCAILLASLIVVIPVLQDGGGKAERLAEQARLRAKLAEEIDLQRDNARAGHEALNRRIAEVEQASQKTAEAAVTAVAQRASAEINALKSALAALSEKVQATAAAAQSKDALDELTEQHAALATTVRAVIADADDAIAAKDKLEAELKSVRDELKKAAKSADKSIDKLTASLEALREEIRATGAPPARAAAPAASAEADEAEEADELADEDEAEVEVAPAPAPVAATSDGATGTALIVNLMIGIGNKPFVRGAGPGLSPDKGVPMNFLGIGRWQWVSPDPEAPATVEVWKNDQSPMGEPLHISGGAPLEVDEGHFGGA